MISLYSLHNTTATEDKTIDTFMDECSLDLDLRDAIFAIMKRLDTVVTEYFNTSVITQKQIDDLVAERDRLNEALEDLERVVQSYKDFPV